MTDSTYRWFSGYDTQTELTKTELEDYYGVSPQVLSDINYLLAISSIDRVYQKPE